MITFKISPTLRSFLPIELAGLDKFPLDLHSLGKEGVAIIDLFARLCLPTDMVTIVLINCILDAVGWSIIRIDKL